MDLQFTAQTKMVFDAEALLRMGVSAIYSMPYERNNEHLVSPESTLANLEEMKRRDDELGKRGIRVYPFFVTINHPEGNFEVPERYRNQRNLDGSLRPGFICFLDETRQAEMLRFARKAVELGWDRIMYDDDLRDAFCYCDVHLRGFEPFRETPREKIAGILNGVLTDPEDEELRREWYAYKRAGLEDYARRLEHAVHEINPRCRIGLSTSAKRCQDFSGRRVWDWAKLFHTEEAPTFVRLAGECYNDSLLSLAQSTGWHQYINTLYPSELERRTEITAVQTISYRLPGQVLFEAMSVEAATKAPVINWAMTEDFHFNGLDVHIANHKDQLAEMADKTPGEPESFLIQYIGEELGPYTPPDISTSYGATHDPVTSYCILALVGIPVVPRAEIPPKQPAVYCGSYISREMVEEIDAAVDRGTVVLLDAIAAQGYRLYGGRTTFGVTGPSALHRQELGADGRRIELAYDCPPNSIYTLACGKEFSLYESIDVTGKPAGTMVAGFPRDKSGSLIVMGYDLSIIGDRFVRREWRQLLLELFGNAGVEVPVYWSGTPAVQVITYKNHPDKVAVINYNTHRVEGVLSGVDGDRPVSMEPLEVRIVTR